MRKLLRFLTVALALVPCSFVMAATAQESSAGLENELGRSVAEDAATLAKGRISAQQKALWRLGAQTDPEADEVLSRQVELYRARELPSALWLELFEAVERHGNAVLKAQLADDRREHEKSADPLAPFQECLNGGDADSGRLIFMKKPEAGCVRCHSVEGLGGWIGPDLTWLRHTVDRINILESIILPNAVIAKGYKSALLKLKSGEEVSGVVNAESADELILTSVIDGTKRKVPVADIVERTPLPSPMPPAFGAVLSKREIRDLIEFLAEGD